jgi:dTDP-4-dehydrorhamnose reductase
MSIVIGGGGLVGRALLEAHKRARPLTEGTSRTGIGGLKRLDLLNPDISGLNLRGVRDALITASLSGIAHCQNDPDGTRKINVEGTLKLMHMLYDEGVRPVFFSSDYVFDGKRGGYADDAPVRPSTEYGRQKAEVEEAMMEMTGGRGLALRLSKVFTLAKGDGTLFDEMASALSSGKTVRAATDQVFNPIALADVVRATLVAQAERIKGIVNVCSSESWTRYELAVELAARMGVDASLVEPIKLGEVGIERPLDTSMKPQRLLDELGLRPASIRDALRAVADNWSRIV